MQYVFVATWHMTDLFDDGSHLLLMMGSLRYVYYARSVHGSFPIFPSFLQIFATHNIQFVLRMWSKVR